MTGADEAPRGSKRLEEATDMAEQGIISGIMATVEGEELQRLLSARSAHHLERAKVYRQQAAVLPRRRRVPDSSNILNSDSLISTAEHHEQQAVYMRFMADHVETEARYRLHQHELQQLGIGADD